ncbi:MAG: FprA family A-type flavoprotein [Clostridiales Family XIII bacterium]|jgi:flavorubredoxin|nr:FprA family A-type flavoprotein [Clostridiales Family XIII bacterium]
MHSVRLITDNLYWVGANEHRLELFENIHPLDGIGVSYNSYLLLDKKTVLFDTVDWAVCRQYLENIEFVLAGRPLDYLVINHLEPDHAASIEEVLIRHPETTVISNEKAFMQMRQFGFGDVIDGRYDEVQEGDTRTFGDHTVAWVYAPMVHWPEAMVALDVTNGALFSADGFGSFKALDGVLFADEVDFDRDWLDEARRYLTNIVGKYGPHIQALLAKAGPLLPQVKYICPLHGPVWREDFGYIIGKYDKWSRYEPEVNGVLIIYASMYGNTESAAVALAAKLRERGVKDVKVRDVSNTHVSWLISETFKYSHVVIASVTYNLGIYPLIHNYLMDMKALNVQQRTFAVIENGTWAPKAGDLIREFLDKELKQMTVLNDELTINSHLSADNESEMDSMADSIADSVKSENAAKVE